MVSSLFCGLPKARWVNVDQLHLTLRYIGPINGSQLEDVKEFLNSLENPSFELELSGVGQFSAKGPNRQQRHVLWVGCSKPPELLLLHKQIEMGLREIGLPAERLSFSPHVTLARLEGEADGRLAHYLETFAHFSTPSFDIRAITLYSSDRSKEEVCYIDEKTIQLLERP
jgi:RNA 2',3'-cyclic 3'-phosphodiesterase